jgi:dihydroflavonol-4-reductase
VPETTVANLPGGVPRRRSVCASAFPYSRGMAVVLVTGANGFIGSHLVRRLVARGDRVRCLVRRRDTPESLKGLPVELVVGDVTRPASLRKACEGVEEVFHLAARLTSRTRREMFETNAVGTRRLLDAAWVAGPVRRFVYCSSLAVTGPSGLGAAHTEDAPHAPLTAYGASKALGERIVHAFRDRGLATTIVRPPVVYGPRDRGLLQVFQAAARGLKPLLGPQPKRYSWVYGDDLAEALVVLGRAPAAVGRTYFAAHPEVTTLEDFLDLATAAVGKRGRTIAVPEALLSLAAAASDLVAQVTGTPAMLTRDKMNEIVPRGWTCSPAAAERDGCWRAKTPIAEGVPATVAWYRENGWI